MISRVLARTPPHPRYPLVMQRRTFLVSALSAAGASRAAGANDRISIAMIGCGRRNLLGEVLEFARDSNVNVVAVCDTWRQQREEAAARVEKALGARPEMFVHYPDVAGNSKIDAVVIGTPDHQHCTQLIAAVRAGKDAYVEKPLAMDMHELIASTDAVKRSGKVVQCGTQIRSYPASVSARAFVTEGKLGPVMKVEQVRNSYHPYWHAYGERKVDAADVDWKAFLLNRKYRPFDADQYAAWYGYREFSRGPQTNLMVHFIDLVHYITGCGLPRRAVGFAGTYRWKDRRTAPDSVEAVLEYDGFLVRYATVFGTGAGNYLKFFGTRGTLDATRWSWNQPFTLSGEGSGEADKLPPGSTIPMLESTPHMKNWFDCLRSRKAPNAPIEAGYAHSVAVIMADEAMFTGRRMVYDASKRAVRAG